MAVFGAERRTQSEVQNAHIVRTTGTEGAQTSQINKRRLQYGTIYLRLLEKNTFILLS